jgi:hypothetical protein
MKVQQLKVINKCEHLLSRDSSKCHHSDLYSNRNRTRSPKPTSSKIQVTLANQKPAIFLQLSVTKPPRTSHKKEQSMPINSSKMQTLTSLASLSPSVATFTVMSWQGTLTLSHTKRKKTSSSTLSMESTLPRCKHTRSSADTSTFWPLETVSLNVCQVCIFLLSPRSKVSVLEAKNSSKRDATCSACSSNRWPNAHIWSSQRSSKSLSFLSRTLTSNCLGCMRKISTPKPRLNASSNISRSMVRSEKVR